MNCEKGCEASRVCKLACEWDKAMLQLTERNGDLDELRQVEVEASEAFWAALEEWKSE
tara:strand:+ start:83 stop:256 length:174 start_codon:yes stop_codon:yes gene_type:complete